MTRKEWKKLIRFVVIAAILFWLVPWVMAFFLFCGLIDIARHRRLDRSLWLAYFSGNGLLTWLISPFNLFCDLISYPRPYILNRDQLTPEIRAELDEVLNLFDARREEILQDVRARMGDARRGMLFYKWYGRNADTSVPEFNRDFAHVHTIGVSVFRGREKTSLHFGPARLTVRVLYNLMPRRTDRVYIEANGHRHYWHDDPLFIFDDTVQHISVNDDEVERAVAFIDILRPSPVPALQRAILRIMAVLLSGVNRAFYKNWNMLAKPADGAATAAPPAG